MVSKILIGDDQRDVLKALELLLKPKGYLTKTASNAAGILDELAQNEYDVVMIDMNYVRGKTSGIEGLDLLTRIKQINHEISVVVMTAWSSVELAVEAMKQGASDFIAKPFDNERLLAVLNGQVELRRALRKNRMLEQENRILKQELDDFMIAESKAMRPILETISKVGPSDANVLVTGENGSGKGVVARALHKVSPRKNHSLITVNTASIPESVFESELFGHVAGAFTDAKNERLGRFALADGGTLFLDEIATVPVNLQPKLLRVLENREYEPIGSSKTCHCDVRIISATNANLTDEITKGQFRQDLFYRLNTVEIKIPSLRERLEDIPLLADFFLKRYVKRYRKKIDGFASQALQSLLKHSWPGNVRELDHTVERAVLMTNNTMICEKDLVLSLSTNQQDNFTGKTLEQIEINVIQKALSNHNNDISKTAQELGLSRGALYRRMEKYNIQHN